MGVQGRCDVPHLKFYKGFFYQGNINIIGCSYRYSVGRFNLKVIDFYFLNDSCSFHRTSTCDNKVSILSDGHDAVNGAFALSIPWYLCNTICIYIPPFVNIPPGILWRLSTLAKNHLFGNFMV